MRFLKYICLSVISLILFGVAHAHAATLTVSPTTGTFSVGSTFNVSIYLDTQGEEINVVDVGLLFPPDKIQVVSRSSGQSIIGVWTSQPRFNNQTGEVTLQGGVPGGINVSRGLIINLTFRVKQVGGVTLRFKDSSRVLLNDGKGTDALRNVQNGIYTLTLPPPAGPIVASETHPDQTVWYPNQNVILRWAEDQGAEGYSYEMSNDPIDIPDNISEGPRTGITYRNQPDGVHYFHIKALRGGVWGGTTHFAVNVDTLPPAEFPIEISPRKKTINRHPIISWQTTDAHSGLDHYEIKLINLSQGPLSPDTPPESQPFFIEADSPYTPELQLGKYDVVIRAYDKAGNYYEKKEKLEITQALFSIIASEGIRFSSRIVVPWFWVFVIVLGLIALLGFIGWTVWQWHRKVEENLGKGALSDPVIKSRLAELKKRQALLAKTLIILLFATFSIWLTSTSQIAKAQVAQPTPPLVTLFSENITNEELFYIGGKSEIPGGEIVIYLQNTQTGETLNLKTTVDKTGNWFYSYSEFLPTGQYLLWAQTKRGEELSAPSPQFQMDVTQTAIQFGASRLSYETLYLFFSIILLLIVIGLAAFIGFHGYHGRKKRLIFLEELKEAEEAIQRGFAVLRKDIQAELAIINNVKLNKTLAAEEKRREEELMRDLDWIEKEIGKEVLDIERL